MYKFTMSVKSLVEFLYQSGDLTSSFMSNERANLGSRIHRMLQETGGDNYQSEVFLKQETILDDSICFIIEGRADGIITQDDVIYLDEIKSTYCDYDEIHEDMCFTHWAQAYAYAYIYALQQQLSQIIVQLTYYQIDINEKKQFQRTMDFSQLTKFYIGMLEEYKKWAMLQYNFSKIRNTSISQMEFPFPQYRNGQRELAVAVYKTILDEDIMFVQAPTGIGKTISTLFPGIKAIGEKKIERIFYLCAKNITAKVAQDSISLLCENGLRIKCTTLTAKDKMCLLEERNCDPKVCPYAAGYYDRIQEGLFHLLEHHDYFNKELFLNYGQTYQLCPFELSLDTTLYSDIIICDYNYVFDPRVYLKRFFSEPGNFLFLIDEAHNMIDRARSMYSAQLQRSMFVNLRKLLAKEEKSLRKVVLEISKYMKGLEELCEDGFYVSKEEFTSFALLLNRFQKECDSFLQKEQEQNEEIKTIYFEVLAYLRIHEYYDDHFVNYVQLDLHDVIIKQFCLNPSRPIDDALHKGAATVFFSATLTPIHYFTSLLLKEECKKKIALPSPFGQKQCKILINNAIDTRYKVRAQSIDPICDMIATTIQKKAGNYIVFFPSYAYLQDVANEFMDQYPDVNVNIQQSFMSEEDRSSFLSLFDYTEETMVCFCVLGGMFSEGIDLKGDKLIGTIIVGVGLPQINHEQNLIRNFFDEAFGTGYDYAYVFPGMNKVLQAAGRVIRSSSDKGIVLLLDERYASNLYRSLFPAHMKHYEVFQNSSQLHRILTKFWEEQ